MTGGPCALGLRRGHGRGAQRKVGIEVGSGVRFKIRTQSILIQSVEPVRTPTRERCGRRTAVIHSNETVPGERGNFQKARTQLYAILHCLWRTSRETTFHRTTAREPLPSVDHNHACHSGRATAEPLPFVDHARCSPVKRYHHIRKETSSCNLYFRRLGIRETVPTRRLPP
jgi:hypothetical protein